MLWRLRINTDRPIQQGVRMTATVNKWTCDIKRLCTNYKPSTVLALIAVESAGDDKAHRPLSQFYGLLQMGKNAGIDVGFRDEGRHTTKALNGNGVMAIEKWHKYAEKYRARHRDEPERIALLWKAGPGYLKHVNEETDAGASWDAALDSAEKRYDFSAREYLKRFEKFQEEYE
jgi:hypothetical protein